MSAIFIFANDLETVRINASAYYLSFYQNSQKVGTRDDLRQMLLRQILWSEGIFVVLKREYKLNKIPKRGIQNATKECLLSATVLNLKKAVRQV